MNDSGIIRKHKKRHNFVTIDKTSLEDKRLSYKARGILAYLLTKPDDWTTNTRNLVNQSVDGKTSVLSGLKELEDNKYLARVRYQNHLGQFAWEMIVFETNEDYEDWAENSNLSMFRFSVDGKPEDGKPEDGKPEHIINNDLQNNEKLNNEPPIRAGKIQSEFSDLTSEEIDSCTISKKANQDTPPSALDNQQTTRVDNGFTHKDQANAKFDVPEQTNKREIEDFEDLPKLPNGNRQVPWENLGRSLNNRYNEDFAEWLYKTQLIRYTGFTKEGYAQNKNQVRGYLMKAHTDKLRMEKILLAWNDYVSPQEQTSPQPALESFLTRCGDKLRGIILSHDFTPEQLAFIAEVWDAADGREELTLLFIKDRGLINSSDF